MMNREHIALLRSLSFSVEEFERGMGRLRRPVPGMTVREMLDLHWPNKPAEPKGLTIADLTEPEPVHPKRLLAELAEEFDRGVGI